MHRFIPCCALVFLSSCGTLGLTQSNPSRALIGKWDNRAQMAAAPESLKQPPVAGGAYEWIDGQHATFFAVDAPTIAGKDGKVIYLVWRSGGPSGTVSRQRLWVFRDGPNGQTVMDFYAFKNPQMFEAASRPNPAFKALTLGDLTAYGPACALPVMPSANGWSASIPATCSITARSGRSMVLSAQIVLDGDRLSYSEQGTLASGGLAFKVPGGPAYEFTRLERR